MKKTFKFVGMVLLTILLMAGISSCSKDDDEKLPPPPTEILGTWSGALIDEGESYSITMTFNQDNTGSLVDVYSYSDVYSVSFKYTVTGDITTFATLHYWGTDSDGEKEDNSLGVSVNGNRLTIYGDGDVVNLYKGYNPQPNPTPTPTPTPTPDKGRDELSNTSWVLQSITGWAAGEYADEWVGEILEFGNNGQVTEIYNTITGGSAVGSYTISGNTITFTGISAWIDNWGSSFTYSLSGNNLRLSDKSNLNSTFNFTKY